MISLSSLAGGSLYFSKDLDKVVMYCWTTGISALVLIQDCRCGTGEEQSLKDRVGHFLSFHDHVLKLVNPHR